MGNDLRELFIAIHMLAERMAQNEHMQIAQQAVMQDMVLALDRTNAILSSMAKNDSTYYRRTDPGLTAQPRLRAVQ